MAAAVTVVTDSTACLPAGLAARCGIAVVPLRVVAAGLADDDGPSALSGPLGEELGGGARLSTASPAPERFAAAYAAAAQAGAGAVVSVHVSAGLSGTVSSATLAASAAPVPVRVVDSRSLGMGLGFAALAAAEAAAAGADPGAVAGAARDRAQALGSFFVLDALDELHAGGRLSPDRPGAAAGLTFRPLLHLAGGRVAVLEKLRTPSAAVRRLEEVAAEFAGGRPVDVAVQYLGPPERGEALARRLEPLIPGARHRYLAEAGPVIRAHTGPGMLGVVVAPY
ncbi:MAG TPA: DegV family protein [Streptosporangiaceae bacterium]|nr:DegV family protein [Streptosporangiaceae bacterium]